MKIEARRGTRLRVSELDVFLPRLRVGLLLLGREKSSRPTRQIQAH